MRTAAPSATKKKHPDAPARKPAKQAPRKAAERPAKQPAKPPAKPPARRADAGRDAYHHGALREALIEATEALLAERGTDGFSLREVARRSGVSPAAPAHHFGDAAGLLTAVTTLAFDGLTAALQAGNERGGNDAVARLREQGLGYVGFALKYPGRFGLMFRCLPGDAGGAKRHDDALTLSARAAFTELENGVRLLLGVAPEATLSAAHWQAILSIWSVVHGFAHLALAGQFEQVLQAMSTARGGVLRERDREPLLRQVLAPMLEQQVRALRAHA